MPAKRKRFSKDKGTRITKASCTGRVQRQMKQGKYAQRISPLAAVVLAATIEVCHYHFYVLILHRLRSHFISILHNIYT